MSTASRLKPRLIDIAEVAERRNVCPGVDRLDQLPRTPDPPLGCSEKDPASGFLCASETEIVPDSFRGYGRIHSRVSWVAWPRQRYTEVVKAHKLLSPTSKRKRRNLPDSTGHIARPSLHVATIASGAQRNANLYKTKSHCDNIGSWSTD